MSALDDVATVAEIVALCDVNEDAVRRACERAVAKGKTVARQSGSTWLMLKTWAFSRWEPLPTESEIDEMIDAADDVDHSYMGDDLPEDFIEDMRKLFPPKEY